MEESELAFYILILTSLASSGQTNNYKHKSMCFLINQLTVHASGYQTFITTKKSCFVGLEKQTVPIPTQQAMPPSTEQKVPYLLRKLYVNLRSREYPCLLIKQYPYLLSKQYPYLLSNQKVLVELAIMGFSLCYTRFRVNEKENVIKEM